MLERTRGRRPTPDNPNAPAVSPAATPGFVTNSNSGALASRNKGGSKISPTSRTDGKLWYRELKNLAERSQTAHSPAEAAKFLAAFNRLATVEAQKQGKTVDELHTLFFRHPFVGVIADETFGFGASAATQTRASFQRQFKDSSSTFGTMLSRDDVRGPEPRRKIDDSGIQSQLNMQTVRNPGGQPVKPGIVRNTGR